MKSFKYILRTPYIIPYIYICIQRFNVAVVTLVSLHVRNVQVSMLPVQNKTKSNQVYGIALHLVDDFGNHFRVIFLFKFFAIFMRYVEKMSMPKLNDYELLEIIGNGSYSVVHRAKHKVSNLNLTIIANKKQKQNKKLPKINPFALGNEINICHKMCR